MLNVGGVCAACMVRKVDSSHVGFRLQQLRLQWQLRGAVRTRRLCENPQATTSVLEHRPTPTYSSKLVRLPARHTRGSSSREQFTTLQDEPTQVPSSLGQAPGFSEPCHFLQNGHQIQPSKSAVPDLQNSLNTIQSSSNSIPDTLEQLRRRSEEVTLELVRGKWWKCVSVESRQDQIIL